MSVRATPSVMLLASSVLAGHSDGPLQVIQDREQLLDQRLIAEAQDFLLFPGLQLLEVLKIRLLVKQFLPELL